MGVKSKSEMRELIEQCRAMARNAPPKNIWGPGSRALLFDAADAIEQAMEAMPGPVRFELKPAEYRALRAAKAVGLDYACIESTGSGNRIDAIANDFDSEEGFRPIDDLLEGVEPEPELTDLQIELVWRQEEAQALGLPDAIDFARAVIAADRAKRDA